MVLTSKPILFELYFSDITEVEQDLSDTESNSSDATGTTKLPSSEILPMAKDSNLTKSDARMFDAFQSAIKYDMFSLFIFTAK